jgi:uncharacterized protein YjbI with pentapeptide repeats
MANPEHLAKLKEGVEAWKQWREEPWKAKIGSTADYRAVDLSGADLTGMHLTSVNLFGADLSHANLTSAVLMMADLRQADLHQADLTNANMSAATFYSANLQGASLRGANLSGAQMDRVDLREADLSQANLFKVLLNRAKLQRAILRGALLVEATLRMADLTHADLRDANLYGANLHLTNLSNSNLTNAQLGLTNLVRTNFEGADLSESGVYGVSVWDARLEGATQSNLVVTPDYLPTIQVDSLEVAQFIYLLLNNERIRHVIDTITSKVVLILGRFTPERKAVLDAIRDELRKRDYLPILFDFQKPDSKSLTGTVSTLANMARFIIADLTDPSSIPYELGTIVPHTKVPVQAIILDGRSEFAMFNDLLDYHWVLPPYRYQSEEVLLANLKERVIAPAEAKVVELRRNI